MDTKIIVSQKSRIAFTQEQKMEADHEIFVKFMLPYSGSTKKEYLAIFRKMLQNYENCKRPKTLRDKGYLEKLIENFDAYITFARAMGWIIIGEEEKEKHSNINLKQFVTNEMSVTPEEKRQGVIHRRC